VIFHKYCTIIKKYKKGSHMQASFILDSNEFDHKFIDKLRAMFQNKRVELYVSEADDTEYLSTSEINKKILLQSITNIENQQNLVVADSKIFT